MSDPAETGAAGRSRSGVVALGILLSRLMGLARQRAVAHFLGTSPWADVLVFALRAPNVLQNLLGEGTLSASFIPVYSRMLAEGRREEAGRLAGAVFGLLLALAGGLALVGVLLAEPLVALLGAGFLKEGEGAVDRFALAVTAVRITFPMTGALVLHAWALGVLNSHRRFFLPYAAPVLWNAAIIAALVGAGSLLAAGDPGPEGPAPATLDRLLYAACFGALAGGVLQFLVQLPLVLRVMSGFRPSLSTRVEGVRRTLRAFGPMVAGRGAVQLGSWLDLLLATFLAVGAISALGYAQVLYVLPISLFAMSVAAAELPELSRLAGDAPGKADLRLERSLRQSAFLVLPTAIGYLAFGYLLVAAVYRTGSFGMASNLLVYLLLAVYTLGLPASAVSRLLQNVYFAAGDTRTPAAVAAQRVLLAAGLAVPLMVALDRVELVAVAPAAAGSDLRLGALGLAAGSAAGAWFELVRLLRGLRRRGSGPAALPWRALGRMAALALAAAAPATLLWHLLPALHPALTGLLVIGAYAGCYLLGGALARFPEIEPWLGRLPGRAGGRAR